MSSSNAQHTEWILETIDHLRKRKARPDLQRICHVVRRRYGLPSAVTEAKLEKLVDAEIVIKVEYKGSTSYRNASKWRKNMIGCTVQNSTSVSTKIIEAIIALSKETSVCGAKSSDKTVSGTSVDSTDTKDNSLINDNVKKEDGILLADIEAWLRKHCDGFSNIKSPLSVVLQREVEAGRIEKNFKTGRFVISRAQKEELIDDAVKLLEANKRTKPVLCSQELRQGDGANKVDPKLVSGGATKNSLLFGKRDNKNTSVLHQPTKRGRPPKFRSPEESSSAVPSSSISKLPLKRPSIIVVDAKIPTLKVPKKAQQPSSSAQEDCELCSRPCGKGEIMLKCRDCSMKAHSGCLKYNPVLASRAANGPWQCMECKTCCLCNDASDGDMMLFCDGCDKGYHMMCHMPPVSKKPVGHWECYGCRLENSNLGRNEFAALHVFQNGGLRESAPPTPAESPTPSSSADGPNYSDFPDASKWSTEEVADYFKSAGFPNEAQIFKEQEIDGVALLLLKRSDVLKGLDLKLGPALKLNRLIQGFQTAKIS